LGRLSQRVIPDLIGNPVEMPTKSTVGFMYPCSWNHSDSQPSRQVSRRSDWIPSPPAFPTGRI